MLHAYAYPQTMTRQDSGTTIIRVARRSVLAAVFCLPPLSGQLNAVAAPAEAELRIIAANRTGAAAERAALLDSLFGRLRRAGDRQTASRIEQQIWAAWLGFDDPQIDAWMDEARQAMSAGRFQAALGILDRMVAQAPGYAEGWNKRATVLYLVGRHDESLADIDRVLALEPRHFGAISGIALIMLAKGNNKAVLEAVEQALRIHPYLPGAADLIRRAGGADDGQPI